MNYETLLKKFKVEEGDSVSVKAGKHENEGIVLPSAEEDKLVLKLNSGYNVGFNVKDVKGIKLVAKKKKVSVEEEEVKKNPKLPTIAILHTGGTIASKVDYETGGVVPLFNANDLLKMVPELKEIANLECKTVSNIFSEDMRFTYYTKLAEAIEKELDDKDIEGIIVTHGTDTMAYTSAVVNFMFEKLNKPILFVGTQRSSDRPSSEVAMNLVCAVKFIAESDFAEVGICMHDTVSDDNCVILPGTKTRKMHSSRRDAFKPVNASEIALVNYKTGKTEFSVKEFGKKNSGNAILKEKLEEKVGLLKTHPNLLPEEIDFFREKKFKGLIIEGTGFGHIPINNEDNAGNVKALQKLIGSGCVVGMTSQCIFGRANSGVYATGRKLRDYGIIYCEDMLPETAFVKLAWLLGNYKLEEVKKLLAENLRGEITQRTKITDYYLGK